MILIPYNMRLLATFLIFFITMTSCIMIGKDNDSIIDEVEKIVPVGDEIDINIIIDCDSTDSFFKKENIKSVVLRNTTLIENDSIPLKNGYVHKFKMNRLLNADCISMQIFMTSYDDRMYITAKDLSDLSIKSYDIIYRFSSTSQTGHIDTKGFTIIAYSLGYKKIVREHI